MKFVKEFRNITGNYLLFVKEENDNIDINLLKKINLEETIEAQTTRILFENGSLYEIPNDLDIGYCLTIETTFVRKEAPRGNLELGFSYEDSTKLAWSNFKDLKLLDIQDFDEIAKDMDFNETHEIYEIELINANSDEIELICYVDK